MEEFGAILSFEGCIQAVKGKTEAKEAAQDMARYIGEASKYIMNYTCLNIIGALTRLLGGPSD